ncbi:hypothetical protein GCM10010260_42550 [Streptomyces filipinensis]|uniref:Uncharacterized protein n=1 Tax=Streptomyces filipinensis TaxID=66887 RepID=A0A918MBH6_9ACTN|nr:hypothetical protein GCM10010260_42550 [Streptomyces filipinensis]
MITGPVLGPHGRRHGGRGDGGYGGHGEETGNGGEDRPDATAHPAPLKKKDHAQPNGSAAPDVAPRLAGPTPFALWPECLVPWGAIGDKPLGCVIICTHHSRARVSGCAGGVA